ATLSTFGISECRLKRKLRILAEPEPSMILLREEFMRDARYGWLLAACMMLGVAIISMTALAGEPAKDDSALYKAAAAAVAKGNTEKTKMLGFSIIKTAFTEVPREGAVLVGFDLGIGKFVNIECIHAIRAVYRTAIGEVSYGEHGLFKDKQGPGKQVVKSKVTRTVSVRARPGYAVGALTLRPELNINGLAVIFMRIDGTALDPNRSYTSEWIGDRTGGSESTISGVGAPVIGIFGNEGPEHVMALGLVRMEQPEPPATVQPPPA